MLDGHERISLKGFQGETVARGSQCLGVKYAIVAVEELLNDVEYGGLTRTSRSIQDEKLLNSLGIARHNGANGPLNLATLFWRIQRGYELVISRNITILNRIGQSLTRVVLLFDLGVREYKLLVERMEVVSQLLLNILVPPIDHARFGVPKIHHGYGILKNILVLLFVFFERVVDKSDGILFVSRPPIFFFNPDSVEISTANHEIV